MTDAQIVIKRIDTETIRIPIVGTAPLMVNKFTEKSKRKMLDDMQGRKSPKQIKDPQADYDAAFYRCDDGTPGFPVIAFKAATVSAARFYGKEVSMTGLRQFMFFDGEFSNVEGIQLARLIGEPHMREDAVKVGVNGRDLRYRPCFTTWTTTIDVVYVRAMLTRESVVSLVEAGGLGVGVGEWRPERRGDFGTYQVDSDRDVEVLA